MKKSVLNKILYSYIVILLIPMIISGVVYNESINIAKKDAMNSHLSMLEQTREILDIRMKELDSLALQISWDPKVESFLYSYGPLTDTFIYTIFDMLKDLYVYRAANGFLIDFYIYFRNSNTVITPDAKYGLEEYYSFFSYADMDYSSWAELVSEDLDKKRIIPVKPMAINGIRTNVISYMHPLPLDNSSQQQAMLVFLIDEMQIKQLLQNIGLADSGAVYVLDTNDNIISAVNEGQIPLESLELKLDYGKGMTSKKVNGQNMLVSYSTSEITGWRFISVIPEKVIMSEAYRIRTFVMVFFSLCMILGVPLSYMFAYKNSKPLKEIVNKIKLKIMGLETEEGEDKYKFIENAFTKIVDESTTLKNTVQKQISILTENFYIRLLKGDFSDQGELRRYMAFIGLDVDALYYASIIFRLNDLKESEISKIVVINTVMQFLDAESMNGYAVGINGISVGVFMSYRGENKEKFHDDMVNVAIKVRETLSSRYNIISKVSIGLIYDDIWDVSRSYDEADMALRYYTFPNENAVICYKNLRNMEHDYYYSPELELKLVNSIRTGDQDGVKNILDNIHEENYIRRQLSPKMMEYFLKAMDFTLVKMINELNNGTEDCEKWEVLLEKSDNYESAEEQWQYMCGIFNEMCEFVRDKKKSHNDVLRDSILEYIENNFIDVSLSLSLVASHFNISESYLSRFFIEQTGENFSTYLSTLRIRKAEELLGTGDCTIEQIARNTGFNSANVFIRAFKRINGITPGMYREMELSSRKQ